MSAGDGDGELQLPEVRRPDDGDESDSDGGKGRRRRGQRQADDAAADVLSLTHHTGQAARLAVHLNAEKGIPPEAAGWLDPLTRAEGACGYTPAPAARKQLAVVRAFLWRVHGVDYFGGWERSLVEIAVAFAGEPGRPEREPAPLPKEGSFGAGEPWEGEVDRAWAGRAVDGRDPTAVVLGKVAADRALAAFFKGSVKALGEGKFGCGLCEKLFQTEQFVEKHLHNKHKEVVEKIRAEALDAAYLDNYLRHCEAKDAAARAERARQQPGGDDRRRACRAAQLYFTRPPHAPPSAPRVRREASVRHRCTSLISAQSMGGR